MDGEADLVFESSRTWSEGGPSAHLPILGAGEEVDCTWRPGTAFQQSPPPLFHWSVHSFVYNNTR